MNKIKNTFQSLRLLPILFGVHWRDEQFAEDLKKWKDIYKIQESDTRTLAILLWDFPEFRNLFLYRHRKKRLYCRWVSLWYKPMETLYIQAKEIGGGLFIQHGFATMISAESIGKNCWINQQVTIGYKGHGRAPIILDDVMITCGAKILGSITIGNKAIIGANAVVVRDVEPRAVMGGVPAVKIKENLD